MIGQDEALGWKIRLCGEGRLGVAGVLDVDSLILFLAERRWKVADRSEALATVFPPQRSQI